MKALLIHEFGGPEVLRFAELPDPRPTPGTAVVRMKAIGLNFADVYRRKGTYHLEGKAPFVLGYEGAGVIEAVEPTGGGPSAFQVGDRVAFADVPHANAERVVAPLSHLVPLPEDLSFELAAASMLQGLTAHYLARDSHRIQSGESVLVHAAAGGVGLLLVQIAKLQGATVMGVVSTTRKGESAREAGCDVVALTSEDWVAVAHASSKSMAGVDVVYDSIGATLHDSLRATKRGGHVVFYGMAGGDPAPVNPRQLMDESKSLTGGDLWNVLTSSEERIRRSQELFGWLRSGQVKVRIDARFPLAEGAQAHALLESRRTSGKVLLLP